jgi:mitochondrial fission protein ELM1
MELASPERLLEHYNRGLKQRVARRVGGDANDFVLVVAKTPQMASAEDKSNSSQKSQNESAKI